MFPMRRLCFVCVRPSVRCVSAFASLLRAQASLKGSGRLSRDDAAHFAEFFRVAPCTSTNTSNSTNNNTGTSTSNSNGSVVAAVREHCARLQRDAADQSDSRAVRLQAQEERAGGDDVPLFLVAWDPRAAAVLHFFSVAHDRVVAVSACDENAAAALADELMRYTHGATRLVLIPLLPGAHSNSKSHSHSLSQPQSLSQSPVDRLAAALRRCGLLPAHHVDSGALCAALDALPAPQWSTPPPCRAASAVVAPAPLQCDWFRAHWAYLRTAACRASDGDPTRTIAGLIAPPHDVFVVHLVRNGSHGASVVLFDPLRRRRHAAKGLLSDVLACLLERQARRMIFLPTGRTDRPLLLRCRTALAKVGRQCQIVFASELGERYRAVFHSEPAQYWAALRAASGALDTDLLFDVRRAAGDAIRAYQTQKLSGDNNKNNNKSNNHINNISGGHDALLASREATGTTKTAKTKTKTKTEAAAECVTGAEVERWLSVLAAERRTARETAEARRYKRCLFVAFISTEFAAHTCPANPHAQANYVLAACLMDAQNQLVEPWAKYARRGDFHLPSLDEFDVLVCHDAKHFLLLIWDDAALQRFLKRGGRVWCTMLAEYLLEGQRCQTGANQFRDVAMRYGMATPPSSVLGVVAADLPFAFLRRHLLIAVEALAAIFREQLRRAAERSQLISIAHRSDALLCMAAMEHAGIQIDTEEAVRQAQAVKNRTLAIDKALSLYVPSEVPLDMQRFFDWSSLQHLHAFFFGGNIKLGYSDASHDSPVWTSHLVQFCHAYGNLSLIPTDVHLQRFANAAGLSTTGRLPQRVAQFLDRGGAQERRFRLIVFDIESTGLNTSTDQMIEIAAWDPVEKVSFSSLINPRRPIPQKTTAIHHITDGMVQSAPYLSDVMRSFAQYLRLAADDDHKNDGDAESKDKGEKDSDSKEVIVLIGHNVFALDEPLLRSALVAEGVDMNRILFCDSLVLLKTLKREMLDAKGGSQRIDRGVLETLTSSLRLSTLVEGLRVEADGELHRADTDTKTLWFVLVNALGLAGRSPAKQRDAIFSHAVRTLAAFPGVGCFLPADRRRDCVVVRLPGVAAEVIHSAKKLTELQGKMLNEVVLQTLHRHGSEVAGLLLQKEQLERNAARFLHSDPDGRLSVLHKDGRVRQHIDMCATTTSRTTSSYPSCQNIPKDDKSSLRRLFVSRFGENGRCIELDYSQLEIVVMALLCGDKKLITDLNSGVDFHVKRAEFFSGIPYKEIFEGCKRGVPEYVKLRKTAKTFSFQRLYGAGVSLLHKTTGIPIDDLEASIRLEEKEYPGISMFHRLVRAVALRANNPGLPTHFIVELPTGLRMSFKTRDVVLNLPPLKNYPIQGFGAELAQMMVGRVFRQFVRRDFYGKKAFITNFVHDSLWLDCHVDVLEECVRETRACLSGVHTYVDKTFPGVVLKVPLHVTVQCGVDMCSMESIEDDFSFVPSQRSSDSVEPEEVPSLSDDTIEIIEIKI